MDRWRMMSIMIEFHDSPVEHLQRVSKASPKDWKLAYVDRLSWSFMLANKKTPRTAYMYRQSISRPPTLPSDGRVTMKVWKMTLILFALLM
jgi:hypothetical protein